MRFRRWSITALYNSAFTVFSLWYEFFVHYALRVEKNDQPLEFQFLRSRECLTNPFRMLSLCFGVIDKHQLSSPVIILLKIFLSASAIALMICQDVTWFVPSLRCQGVWNKTCTQLSLSQILFQSLKNYSLGDVQRFCYHSWCDSTVIFDQISNSSNVYLSLSRFWTATSIVIFYQLPPVSKSRIPPKNVWSVHSPIPISLLHQYQFLCRR